MKKKVVLLTRSGRPSGALMAYRLLQAGYDPLILVEKRSAMLAQPLSSRGARETADSGRRGDLGLRLSARKLGEIRPDGFRQSLWRTVLRAFAMTKIIALIHRHGFHFLWNRLCELLLIKTHYYSRKFFGKRFKSPAYLSIEELAITHPLRLQEVSSHNGADTLKILRDEVPDVGILTNTRKISASVLASVKLGFFNVHSSSLPKYAGLDAIFWALYHGEKQIGVTVHEAVPQIDQGGIAASAQFAITEWDTETSLARKATWVGTALMAEVLEKIESGTLELTPQSSTGASYFSWPTREQRRELRKRWDEVTKVCHPREGEDQVPAARKILDSRLRGNDKLSPPRILHIITRMTRGGAQENTLATVRGLNRRGYETVLVTGPSWGPEGEILSRALREGHQVVLLPELGREIDMIKDPMAFLKLFWLVRCGHFDLVHTHMSKGGLIGRLAAWLAGATVIVHTPHGHIFHSYFSRATERFFLFLERRLARVTGRLIALTESEMREHVHFHVGAKAQWTVIPSGVNETLFQDPPAARKLELRRQLGIPAGALIAGFIGRMEAIKGAIYFLEAIPDILKQSPHTRFLFVGGGREREKLEYRAHELGVAGAVTFTGDQKQAFEYISILDVQVVPSLNEGMGRVIVEAGLLQKPVVASRVGGIPDLIQDGKTGLLVPVKDSGAIAAGVVRVLQDTLLGLKLGRNLCQHVLADFTEVNMVQKINRVYRDVLKLSDDHKAPLKSPSEKVSISF